ncbi:Astacin-like metalloendopeptidase [Strongyloides ratti]|uniref:Metalloendopeptidase n=1 Tax=Strongyloides ratti TaxID=34506 RepID=A0A090LQR1_STRRB|nr:Astacin-like metalloendopeptidase [Strongyloides ratti]CEF69921.1 Astacin-like metalloendopeptidase [Strongyloides ratti]
MIKNYTCDFILKRIKKRIKGNLNGKWNLPIYYVVDPNINLNLLFQALNHIQTETCIRFRKINKPLDYKPGFNFRLSNKCFSFVGKVTDYYFQDISIGPECSDFSGIQHEVIHALGHHHEHNRVNRNKYLDIDFKNIRQDILKEFVIVRKFNSETFNIPYEYASIMHYNLYLGSKNTRPTMFPKIKAYKKTVGTSTKATFLDLKYLNFQYCQHICPKKIFCYNWGYQNPNNCNSCKCPEGYFGGKCEKLFYIKQNCGDGIINLGSQEINLHFSGSKYCVTHLKTDIRSIINIKIVNVQLFPNLYWGCKNFNSIEIKFLKDKSLTGARFCGLDNKIFFVSENHHVIIIYRSSISNNYANLSFNQSIIV